MKSRLIAFLVLLAVAGGILWTQIAKRTREEEPGLTQLLNQRYQGQFAAQARSLTNWIVTEAHPEPVKTSDAGGEVPFGDNYPVVIIQSLNSEKPKSIYEIRFSYPADWLNIIPFFVRWEFMNLDKDVDYEIVGEWATSSGGPGGFLGLAVFDTGGNGQPRPVAGFPRLENSNPGMELSDIFGQENSVEFPVVDINAFTRYQDINSDGKYELLFAEYIWNFASTGESRSSPHFWKLVVFQFTDGKFTPASWWNNGQIYQTAEKIDNSEAGGARLVELFKNQQLITK